MKRKGKDDGGFGPGCDNHPSIPASFICQDCGASICDFCNRSDTGVPYCPKCFRNRLDRRFRLKRKLVIGGISASAAFIIGLILLSILLPGPGPEDGRYHVGYSDIIPALNADDPGANDSLPIMFTLYISNSGEKETEGGLVEILLMKGGIQWDSQSSQIPSISKDGMVKVEVKGFHVKEGEWTGRISLWRGEKRDQVISISFKIIGTDIDDFHSDIDSDRIPGISDDSVGDGAASTFIFIFVFAVLVVGAFITIMIVSTSRGYAKLSTDKTMSHPTRSQVINYLKKHPGAHFKMISRECATPPGTLRHHLSVLYREGIVRSRPDGMYRRYYPTGLSIDPGIEEKGSRTNILQTVEKYPGISQSDLSSVLQLSKQTLSYHIGKLELEGLLTSKDQGRTKALFPRIPADPASAS
ncbi:MAG: winged helix-turn-helix transcriptional regulator [Candidatus Thermoplasmatota archaeon]|nr:winged helix-turn-helix transcriptional regulator [Candidatus Thermoplasmatota archaeon]